MLNRQIRPKIVIDAGHYSGCNRSPVFTAYRQGDMTWVLYQFLKEELESYNAIVIGTREQQAKDLPVYNRGQIAAGADLFISLHSNAIDSESVKRVVVIPPFADKNRNRQLAETLAQVVTNTMGIDQKYQIYTRTYVDNGKTRDYYGVIRGAVDAGCKRSMIIEHGFHTNIDCARWLYNRMNLKKLAQAQAAAIAKFFGLKKLTNAEIHYKVGDKYIIKADDIYSDGRPVAKFAIGKEYTVSKVLPGRILIQELYSWIVIK